jgi:hypothetical protein
MGQLQQILKRCPMIGILKVIIALIICSAATAAWPDIYEWTDENGVKHYSNYAPPNGSRVLMKTKEEPYDEAADRERMETERQELQELARLEIAQRELEIELREAEVDRRLAEADRIAEDALREADYYREEARYGSRIIYNGGGYWCRDDYRGCGYRKYDRWYYRDKYRHSYHRRYRHKHHYHRKYTTTHRRHPYLKKHHGYRKKYSDHKYRGQTGYRLKGHYNQHRLKSSTGRKYGHSRIGSRRGSYHGRGGFSRGRGGIFGRVR